MKKYYAAVEGYINGAYRKKGEPAGALSERQAKYLVLSGLVTDKKPDIKPAAVERKPAPKAEPDPATLERKTR